ncbi:MAG TPA: hypothetical protein VGO91_01670 [Pyrinomonadaceae bacterium]|jgi:hypothetical protein|nr:hypothetical protein [Pyrinomonadaceae bacterium]
MGLKLYCNRYAHFKDPLVCSVTCPYRTRCQDFALFYDEHRTNVDALVADYYAARAEAKPRPRALVNITTATEMRALLRLEVKREMPESTYIWIGKDDQAEVLGLDEIIRRAERGAKAKNIYRIAQEMELRFQLVPRKRIDKARRTVEVDAERAAARRSKSRPRPVAVEPPSPLTPLASMESSSLPSATQTRRTRTRLPKAVGEK